MVRISGRRLLYLCLFALLALPLAGCGAHLQAGVMGTPEAEMAATDTSAAATIAALSTEKAELQHQLLRLAAGTPFPSPASLGKLAYVQGGDIWTQALPDGVPQRLTQDGLSREPRWSPSGEWLAFLKGDQSMLWLMRADGTEAREIGMLPNGMFAWSPVQDLLAYVDVMGLQVQSPEQEAPTSLVPTQPDTQSPTAGPTPGGPEPSIQRIAWSPDGNSIALQWQTQAHDQPISRQGLDTVPATGGSTEAVFEANVPEEGEAILAGWTSDGQWILFWQSPILSASILADGVPLYAIPAEGGELRQLVDTMLVYNDFLSAWPGGGAQIAATVGGYRGAWTQKAIHVINAESGEPLAITGPEVAAISPAWAPDGQRLAYVAMPDQGDLSGGDPARQGLLQRRLWVTDLLSSAMPRQLTDDEGYRDEYPRWSADGSYILFARLDQEDRASLWLIPAEGGEAKQVVEELTPAPGWFGYYGHIEWDGLFDWWQRPVPQWEVVALTPTPTPVLRPTPPPVVAGSPVPPIATPAATEVVVPTAEVVPLTPTPVALAPGTEAVIDCIEVYPGLPGCLRQEPLADGQIAFVDQRPAFSGRPVVADLAQGLTAILGDKPARLIGWSPSGERLLVAEGDHAHSVYRADGTVEQNLTEAAQDPFWAPKAALPGSQDWLAVPRDDGSLWALPFFGGATAREVLPAGTLGERATVLWSDGGLLAWTPNADELARSGQWAQELSVRSAEPGEPVTTHRLSDDVREAYYQPISWVPGTDLILAGKGAMAVSLWVDGVPLVSVNAETGEIQELGATMLLTSEAYDWHPTEPGLLALAEGAGRFITQNKRLALLNVVDGTLTYLTEPDVVAFEPAWSPDGQTLAYAALPASDAGGSGEEMERLLKGRAIYLYNGDISQITEPGEAVDGWPQWTADGSRLLYTRQQEGQTDVRVVALDGSTDEALLAGLEDPMCFYGGCGWGPVLAYQPEGAE